MPSVTLGRKRPSEGIIADGGSKNKKTRFTNDGQAVPANPTPASSSVVASTSKVKPDYANVTNKQKGLVPKEDKEAPSKRSSMLVADDIDFPRGGGSSLTPLEHKELRAEGAREAEMEIFQETTEASATGSSRKRSRSAKGLTESFPNKKRKTGGDKDSLRIEYLTYKKLVPGMRILAQVVAIMPASIILSLPHQLFGHAPIDKISKSLNEAVDKLAAMETSSASGSESADEDEMNSTEKEDSIPTLQEMFQLGQYVRAVVSAVHPHGVLLPPTTSGVSLGKPKSDLDRASRRVELSLLPEEVNSGILAKDLATGMVLPAALVSIEDHGYTLDFGIPKVSGFLSFKDVKKSSGDTQRMLKIGMRIETFIRKMEENGRVCSVGIGDKLASSELTNLTSTSAVLPGSLVRALVTASSVSGINVQVLGLFDGTIHPLHSAGPVAKQQVGKKIQARILWEISETDPRQFALSTLDHIIKLQPRSTSEEPRDSVEEEQDENNSWNNVENAFPVGTVIDHAKVSRVETDRGLFLELPGGLEGVVHISDVSDEHVPSLSGTSGPYKVDTMHRARVTGYHALDGILQLSMKESVLQQKWLRVSDITVGELVKGTIMSLTDRGLFVSISGTVHAVVWPNHYADVRLKNPEKKFKVGKSIKCRILVVDPEKNRVCLTAKKTLLESKLPIVSSIAGAEIGALAHAVVFKVSERHLSIEFFNGVKGMIPIKEATDTSPESLIGLFTVGQPIKVRIIDKRLDSNALIASILKAASEYLSPTAEITKLQTGDNVSADVTDIHKGNVVLRLHSSQLPALLSIKLLAKLRAMSVTQLRSSLKVGETLEDLAVISVNPDKLLVIVAPSRAKQSQVQDTGLKLGDIEVGQSYPGVVVRHSPKGAIVRLSKKVSGLLHPTDVADDFSTANLTPPVDSALNVIVVAIDPSSRQVYLSTRASKRDSNVAANRILDPEILDIAHLKIGQTVRGFVKSVADAGLFVTVSRSLDARVQIKELFDEYIKDWKPRFTVNQVVKGRILSIDIDKSQIEMSLRSGDAKRDVPSKSLSDFTEGERVEGVVRKVEEYGVFVHIKDTKISGLCHKSELADETETPASEILKSLKEGDPVRAIILKIDMTTKRISFGLKPSYFLEEDLEADDDDRTDSAQNFENVIKDNAMEIEDTNLSSDDEVILFPKQSLKPSDNITTTEVPSALTLSMPLRWSADAPVQTDAPSNLDTSEDEEGEHSPKKKKRKHEIQQDLTINMQSRAPQSSIDFERLLLSSPNSSYLWLQFMAFQLQLSEIEKAREIGRRALKAINFREEQERLNVWIALLNLEVTYGTEASLDALFKEAARANDSKTIHWRLAVLFDEAQKPEQAEAQFQKACKKFGPSSKVWTLFAEHYFKRSMPNEARQLLPRSLLSLDKRKHLKTISKFAQLEYRMGEPERGRTIFEGIIETHKKRLDLWNVYIDMESGQQDIQRIRSICERAITLKLSKKKAKFLFKKWLELERKLGDEDGAEFVKQKAIEWTQNAANQGASPDS